MALTDEQLELLGNRLVPLYQELEQDVIADIARRVKKTGRYTETAELMARALMEQGYSPARIQREVMKVLRADKEYQMAVAEQTKEYKQYVASEISRVVAEAKEQGNDIVADAGNMAFNADLSMWEQAGKSLSQPSGFHQLVDTMALQTNGELKNLTKSLGFKNIGFTDLENVYQHQLDLGLIKLTSGAFSWQQVVNDCVRELAQSGLRTIDYKSGRSMQLDTAVRNCIRTASGQLAGKVTMLNMDSTGESLVEVSQHWGARSDGSCGHSDHAYWQGKVYTTDRSGHRAESRRLGYPIRNLEDATGYPSDPLGLCGYNCRHSFYVFFEGISEPNQWKPEPAPVTVNGRDYDYYHATQRQRQMERQIRATKREIEAQRALGGDTKELQSKLRKQTADYKRFSSDVDIRPKMERLRVQAGSSDLKHNSGKKHADNVIMHPDGTYNKGAIQMIESIERKNTGKGNANAITHFGTGLNKRQNYLLEQLPEYDSQCVVGKKSVSLSDLSALTAQTGVEFAMFTKGAERLIIRGDERSVNVSKSYALELKLQGYRWSGHTHPGIDDFCLMPSSGDKEILNVFDQDYTAIYNSTGKWYVLEKEVY